MSASHRPVAVVTGSSAGIGAATAVKFAENGCNVVINYSRDPAPALEVATACRKAGVPVTLGSDAHAPEEVARDFPLALEHLRTAGYSRILAYQGRRRDWKTI